MSIVQVVFRIISIYDAGHKHESPISDKLHCAISNIEDLKAEDDFDELITSIAKAKEEYIRFKSSLGNEPEPSANGLNGSAVIN